MVGKNPENGSPILRSQDAALGGAGGKMVFQARVTARLAVLVGANVPERE
jgi:hypothetical protein